MKTLFIILWISLSGRLLPGCQNPEKSPPGTEYPVFAPGFQEVHVNDPFWSPRFHIHAEVTVPDVLQKCEEYGRVQNFAVAAGLEEGKFIGGQSWDDSDLFKVLEAASYQYALYKDENLRQYMDSVINLLALAQEEDGYLVTVMRINGEKDLPWNIRSPRFSYMMWSHELYNFGHLYEAAAAHYEATGQTNLLDVATKNADLLVRTFLTGDSLSYEVDGHPEVETGLLRLWKVTGRGEYLSLMKQLLELRGDATRHELLLSYDEGRNPYFFQDHRPVKEFEEPYGHGVRALYLYASMTDFAIYGNDPGYFTTLNRLWENMVRYKMYITGGVGSRHKGEAFGEKYELPNFSAYNETCSSIANILWNYRMFRYSGDAKYMDICERVLYNAFLAGWALNGCEYNYVNPLESDGHYPYNKGANQRQAWFETSCCPTNISRFLPQVREMIYSMDGKGLYVNLFIAGAATLQAGKTPVHLHMKGEYPWQGQITLEVNPERETSFPLYIRIPSWIGHIPLPDSDLYEYLTETEKNISVRVNGVTVSDYKTDKGYLVLDRTWKKGDVLSLDLPMEVRLVKGNDRIEDNRGKVAIERGPVVYCLEEADNGLLANVLLPVQVTPETQYEPGFLGGITTILMDKYRFIPYYSWGNRGANQMKVWVDRKN